MDFLINVLFDILVGPILRGLRKLYDMFFDFTLFHPKLGTLGMALVLLGIVGLFVLSMLLLAVERWETQLVILKWAALAGGGLVLFALGCAALGPLTRWWRKKRKQSA